MDAHFPRPRKFLSCLLLNLFSISLVLGLARFAVGSEADTYLANHCLRCHNDSTQEGNFRIDNLPRDFTSTSHAEIWFEIASRINAGEMPPEEEPQPTAAESSHFVEWIAKEIKAGERTRMAHRPVVTHYRLSRDEYSRAIEDLLGVNYDTRAPGAFTEDPAWHGFERLGSELSLSPSHVEKYLKAAVEIVEQAFPDARLFQLKSKLDALSIDWVNTDKRKELDSIGIVPSIRTLIWPGHELGNLRPDGGHRQSAGIYRGRIRVSGLVPEGGRAPHLTLYSKELDRMIFEADVIAAEDKPVILEFETFLPAGKFDIVINNAVPGPSNSGGEGRPGGFVFTRLDDPASRAPWQRKMSDDEGKPLYPMLIFDWIEWEGPIEKAEDVVKREDVLPSEGETLSEVRTRMARFAEHAWRRPPTEEEISRYVKLIESETSQGRSLRAASKTAIAAMLASKNFTYISEGSPGQRREYVNDWELASRLSFFLWSSLPDEPLRAAARAGTLHEPDVLRQQVRRMMADKKISRFTDSFPRQWLHLKDVGAFPPDRKLYPEYDDWLETSMVLETVHYFSTMFEKDRPLREFIDSEWTVVNPRLALHYGLPTPGQSDFTPVRLRPEDRRGGLLTHASVLSLTSDGTRHRPVHRGVWLSEVILGKTPPSPPPNVPAIEPNPVNSPKATIRMKLNGHKHDPNCASCHAKIDPLGFAFDHYDAIGRWRTVEIVDDGMGDNPAVDASGVLPDGRAFKDAVDFKRLLASEPELFSCAFTEKLATYALRRAMSVDDGADLTAITEANATDGYRLRSLVEALTLSDFFRRR
jgi:hypothetical protein